MHVPPLRPESARDGLRVRTSMEMCGLVGGGV